MSSTIKATNDTATVAANSAVWVNATSNDTGGAGSLDITSLNLSGTLGTAKLNPSAPNGFEYYPGTAFDYLSVGQSATDTLHYTVSDGHGHTSVASVTITVQGVNAPPVAGSVTATTDAYDAIAVNALASDSDPNLADTLTITGLNLAGTKGTATIDPVTGKIDYNPNGAFDYLSAGQTATDTLHYTVSDNHGATSTGTMTITVTGVNTPPTALADNVTTSATQWINIAPLANDSDLNSSDNLTLQSVNTAGTKGTVQLNASTNTLTYFPGTAFDYLSVGQTATDTFTYTVSDGHGGTSTATDTVTITGVNFAPTAGAVAATDSAYTTIGINALAADKDINLGDKLTITSLNTSGTKGSATIDAKTGEIDYNPNGAFDYLSVGKTATDYFSYTISDGHGGVSTNWVTVTISGVNVAPTARPGTASVAAYGGVWVNATGFDSDINSNDTLSIVGLNTAGTKGTATLNPSATNGFEYNTGSAFDYLSAGETATDTVQYTVSDNHGATTTGTVTITVSGVNVAPVAHADSASTVANQAVTVNVLANDTDVNTDDHLTVASLNTSGTAGNVTIAANGTSVIYTPEGADAALTYGQSATDKFSYTVSDGHGGTSTASVTVSITGPAPTISDLLGNGYLSTDGSQYINAAGQVVRIVATGWDGGDTQNFVPTDLYAVNYQATMREMVSAGFNTIRIPWSDALLHASPAAGSINYGLNPTLQGLNSVQVMQQIVNYAGQIGLKIIFDHHNDEGNSGTQGNGLWYDVGGASNNTDGSGDAGTVSQATFLSDWKTFASLWAGNSTVIGFDLDNEPNHATWTGPSTTSVLTMSEQVGDAVQAIDPGALVIVEAPASNNAPEGDLSVVAANPVVLNVADKLVYSVHEYPQSVNGQTFTGNTAQYIQQMNAAWGYLVADNTAPVWIGEMGSSLATASDQLWAQTLVDYMNGDYAAEGGPGVTGNEQGVSGDWWGWYSTNGSPDGLLQSDYTDLKQNQYAIVQQIGETQVGGAQGSSLIGTTSTISNSLILNMQEDAYNGNAQFTVKVDGAQVGGVQTVTATRSSNVIQQFFLSGNFAPGSHTVTVTFLNDAYGGSTTTDRNLFVKGVTFDGVTQTVTNGSLFNNGSVSVPVTASGTVTTVTAPDTLILQLSTTSGGDTFAVYIDGQQAGGDLTLAGGGGAQTFSLIQDLGGGSHQIDIRQLDAVSGNSTIAVSTVDYDGTQQSITATNASGTMDQDFTISGASVLSGGTISLGNDTADVVVTQPNQMVFLAAGTHAIESDGSGFTLNVAGGSATLSNFNTASGVIDLMGGIGGYAVVSQAVAAIVSDGHGGASLAVGTGSLDFVNVTPSSLSAHNFVLTS